jgi:Protein of unknown function (DUF1592)/Protein of unknown function (DUF1588)/Protein of unknown function (DUF1585)/Protein of unknown function (DUF1587)/Protein of unknown function (DUF1595)
LTLGVCAAQASKPARRLNRYEYQCTVRDLLGVDFQADDAFPADNFSYGFDNNAATLTMTPALMAKYLDAAGKIARAAIEPVPVPAAPQLERYSNAGDSADITWQHKFMWDGEYEFHISIAGRNDPFELDVSLDGHDPQPLNLSFDFEGRRFADTRLYVSSGLHQLRVFAVRDNGRALEQAVAYEVARARKSGTEPASHADIQARLLAGTLADAKGATTPPFPEYVEARGPYGIVLPALPAGYRLVFACGHVPGAHTPACVRQNLSNLARRAWRRSVSASEIDRLMQLVAKESTLQQQMETGIAAILVSPSFLFREEGGDYGLASRVSYFLWSSLPDDELFRVAESAKLDHSATLASQVRRMLADPKSNSLAENFAAQWLEFRNLDAIQRDPVRFPEFTPALRDSMRRETELFVEYVLHEDRSILDFLNARYTFANALLAKLYGVPGVTGDQFRKVDLAGTERTGVLTQASVLAVTSYATRTSPVLRGKWILENLLNEPPPPPPANVAALRDPAAEPALTLRQQLEEHRANPACAGCHARMDALGFGLENFDAIGRWRTRDEALPVDATGTLPDGSKFSGPAELAAILAKHPDAFARCLTEKLLTFALGRGLDPEDRAAAARIAQSATQNGYRLSDLILGVVESPVFRASGDSHE